MSLFSSKKKVTVNLTIQKLFEEGQIPDSARQGIVKGILNDASMVNFMLEEMTNSMGSRVNRVVGWAKRNDYFFGLPQSNTRSNVDAKAVVMNVLATNIGMSVTPVYYTMGPMNSLHYGFSYITSTYGYNAQTNELPGLSASTGYKCYLKNMVATYTKESFDFMQATNDLGMVEQLGPPPNGGYTPSNPFTALAGIGQYNKEPAYEVSSVAVEDYVTITYEFETSPGVFVVRGLTLPMSGVDLTVDFHQCRYKDANGFTRFFTYQQGSGTYPIIDQVFNLQYTGFGTFYPWIYFKANGERVMQMGNPNAFVHSLKVSDMLGVNYRLLEEKVLEDPNYEDVQQSMLMFALNPGDKDPYSMEYLFKHFDLLHQSAIPAPDKSNELLEEFRAFTSSPSQIQVVQDKFCNMTFQFSGITKLRKPGKIGGRGTYTSQYTMVNMNDAAVLVNGPSGVSAGVVNTSQPAWVYRYQVTDSTYDEIAVFGLRTDYKIHTKKGYGAGGDSPKVLIPIDRQVLRSISMRGKEQVLCRGLVFLVSTAVITTTPWYASGPFKVVMLIVAVVITVISLGQAWQAIVAAAALGATALVITVVTYIVGSLVISYGVKLFVQKFGPRIGILAAVVAVAVGAYANSGNATWGDTLVGIGTNLSTTSQDAFKQEFEDILMDIQDFQKYATGMFDSLDDAKKNLGLDGQKVGLEPLDMVYRTPDIRIGEIPDDLYNRTVHSGNIGVIAYDAIEQFVSSKLTLPTLADIEQEVSNDGMAL